MLSLAQARSFLHNPRTDNAIQEQLAYQIAQGVDSYNKHKEVPKDLLNAKVVQKEQEKK